MKLIKPSYEIIPQEKGIEGMLKIIEIAGRTCYKSEPKKGTYDPFVLNLIKRNHLSVLEHGTIYLKVPIEIILKSWEHRDRNVWTKLCMNEYTKYYVNSDYYYFTTNYRVFIEDELHGICEYLCEPTEFHEKRMTVKFITSIGIVRELLRHRKFSFSNESTRYCNYSGNKFGNEFTFIIPSWVNMPEVDIDTSDGMFCKTPEYEISEFEKYYSLLDAFAACEQGYLELINEDNCTPQQVREVLPLATKSELIMTGFESDWKDLFNKRSSIAATGKPHPDMVKLIDSLMKEFNEKNSKGDF